MEELNPAVVPVVGVRQAEWEAALWGFRVERDHAFHSFLVRGVEVQRRISEDEVVLVGHGKERELQSVLRRPVLSAACLLFSSCKQQSDSPSNTVRMPWLSTRARFTVSSPLRTGLGVRLMFGDRKLSISLARPTPLERRGIWSRNSNCSRMCWALGEKAARQPSKPGLSCRWLARARRSRRVSFDLLWYSWVAACRKVGS